MSDVKIELKSVKIYEALSDDTTAFSCAVYVNGVKAFVARNDGQGGCNKYDELKPLDKSRELLRQAQDYARSLPPKPFGDDTLDYDLDLLIDEMLVEWDTNRWLKRHCKSKTVFRLPADEPGTWRTLAVAYGPKVREHLVGKYGDQVEIANERF